MEAANVADVTERLLAEFEGQLDLGVVSRVVLETRRQLDCSPQGALPELVERAARQRLLDLRGDGDDRVVVLPD